MEVQQRCIKSVLDNTLPGSSFDEKGVSNYCEIYEKMAASFPMGEDGQLKWKSILNKLKEDHLKKDYDCIVGLSGGVDSSYLLHLAVKEGLKPLAVYLDNGWSTESSVNNIKSMTRALNVDLETVVLNYEEIKDLMLAYMKAGLPWIDFPTDFAIQATLFKVAKRENIKAILIGYDFRSEGKQPTEWTYGDYKQLNYISKKFGKQKLKSYPVMKFHQLVFWSIIGKIKMIRPFYYFKYNKQAAKEYLMKNYEWQDYGGHHHENAFTKFAVAFWLPKKFNIDKRIITYSAQILSGQLSRNKALELLNNPAISEDEGEKLKNYVIKKLGISKEEFNSIWNSKNHSFYDYPSYFPYLNNFIKLAIPVFKHIFPWKPALFYEMEVRKNHKK